MVRFKMKIMDSFYNDKLGLIVTGIVETGIVRKGDILLAKTTKGDFKIELSTIALPGLIELKDANIKTKYFGLGIKNRKRGEILRGDYLHSLENN
jgi:translation elongation factor EF-Tu-like GTPase